MRVGIVNLYSRCYEKSSKNLQQRKPELTPFKSVEFDKVSFTAINQSVFKKPASQVNPMQVLEKIHSYEFGRDLSDKIFQKFIALNIDFSDGLDALRTKMISSGFDFVFNSFWKTNDNRENANFFILENFEKIINTTRMLGEDTVQWALGMKYQRFDQLLNDVNVYHRKYPFMVKNLLQKMTNPLLSEKYKSLQEEKSEIENKMRCEETSLFFELHEKNKAKISDIKMQIKENKQNKNIKSIKSLYEELSTIRRSEIQAKPMLLKRLEDDMTSVKAEINKLLSSSIKDPQQKIELFYLYKAVPNIATLEKLNTLVADKTEEGVKEYKNFLTEMLGQMYKLSDEEKSIVQKYGINESPYFTRLFQTKTTADGTILVPSYGFPKHFKNLLSILSNVETPKDAFDKLPQNKVTAELFKEKGLNYEVWSTFSPERDVMKVDDRTVIRKIDMDDIAHSLFLGNQACCCTAIGLGSRSGTAPNYLMNKFVQGMELLVDDDVVGNTMCYLAEVDAKRYPLITLSGYKSCMIPIKQEYCAKNQLALIIDNIEMLKTYACKQEYLEAFIKFAKQMAKNIGRENLPIYIGHRNSFNMGEFQKVSLVKMYILGSSGNHDISLDSLANLSVINDQVSPNEIYYGEFYEVGR